MKRTAAYYMLLTCVFVWCAMLFLPPIIISASGGTTPGALLAYKFYSHICHQYDSHSLHFEGEKLAVCARCSCIYFGFLLGSILAPFITPIFQRKIKVLLIGAAFPMILDVLLSLSGIQESTLLSRIFTGIVFGSISGMLFTPMLLEAMAKLFNTNPLQSGTIYESETR